MHLLEFGSDNYMVMVNALGKHKASHDARPGMYKMEQTSSQIYYILV